MEWIEVFGIGVAVGLAGAYGAWSLARRLRARPPSAVVPAAAFAFDPPVPPGPPPEDPAGPVGGGGAPDAPSVRLSIRILVHLAALGRLDPEGVAPIGATQRGIGVALAAEQSAVSKVLKRLEAAGVVEVARAHVRGLDRRVNVYSLTRRGMAVAREVRMRSAPPAREIGAFPHHEGASRVAPMSRGTEHRPGRP
jgi:DNA-binding MarR family transcriptional regulator